MKRLNNKKEIQNLQGENGRIYLVIKTIPYLLGELGRGIQKSKC